MIAVPIISFPAFRMKFLRMQNHKGEERSKRGSNSENDGKPEGHADPVDSDSEKGRTDSPRNAKEHDLPQGRCRCSRIHAADLRSGRERDDPRKDDQARYREYQPAVFPAPSWHSLHRSGKTAVQKAGQHDKAKANHDLCGHQITCRVVRSGKRKRAQNEACTCERQDKTSTRSAVS